MSKKWRRGGGGHRQSKKFHCKFTQFLEKKRNVISKKGRWGWGGQGRLEVFQKKYPYLGRQSSLISINQIDANPEDQSECFEEVKIYFHRHHCIVIQPSYFGFGNSRATVAATQENMLMIVKEQNFQDCLNKSCC